MPIITGSRLRRHVFFWAVWIFSFTFIKSFGASMEVYFAWFTYYLLTLPLFMAHTYLVVYVLIPRYARGWRWVIFLPLFFLVMVGFSFLETALTSGVLASLFPGTFRSGYNPFTFGNLVVSGVGNLYIVFMFITLRLLRSWYLQVDERKELEQGQLRREIAAASSRIQPGFLVYALEELEGLTERDPGESPTALAALSELLNDVMHSGVKESYIPGEERRLIERLLAFHRLLHREREYRVGFTTGPGIDRLPALVVFTMTEYLLRRGDSGKGISLRAEVERDEAGVRVMFREEGQDKATVDGFRGICQADLLRYLDQLFPGRCRLREQAAGRDVLSVNDRQMAVNGDAPALILNVALEPVVA